MSAHTRPNGPSLGRRAQNVDRVLRMTEQLVSALDSTEADLTPAQDALRVARSLYANRDYSEAVAQARRAETLASSLNERFSAYMAAWKSLQSCMEELQLIGFPTDRLEAALSAADKETVHRVKEADTEVPNYAGATAMLEQATADARTLVSHAREASHEILLATLAVQALSGTAARETPSWLSLRLDEMIEQATRELALGHVPAAGRIASEARARADDALAGTARVWEVLDMASAMLDGIGAQGRAADILGAKIASAQKALHRGSLDPTTASVVAGRLSDEVASFAKHFPQAQRALAHAERVYGRLQKAGLCSYEVDVALTQARHAIGSGDWDEVRENLARATQTFVGLRRKQDALAQAIVDVDHRVALLKGFRIPLLPDVEEILSRAKEEVRSGRLSGASEDLILANALMTQVSRSGS